MGQVDIVRASAGSGKTFRLAYEYVKRVVEDPYAFYSIVAVTFTNKATEEMKSRILKELHTLSVQKESPFMADLQDALWLTKEEVQENATKALSQILHNYSFFSVYTIDRFFQKILRAFAAELSLDGDYRVELDDEHLIEIAVEALLQQATTNDDISDWLREYTLHQVENDKNYQISENITKVAKRIIFDSRFDGEVFQLLRSERVAFIKELFISVEDLYEQMRLKAIECKNIMDGASLGVDDFTQKGRGLGAYILKMASADFVQYNSYVAKALDENSKWGGAATQAIKPQLQPLLTELCEMWNKNIRFINSVAVIQKHWRTYVMLSDIASLLDEACRSRSAMLLSKASSIITSLVEGNDAPFIYEKIGNRYTTYMIDEFQDTSLVQWANFKPLLSDAVARSSEEQHSLLFVGDVKQSIYGWRGGDWSILQQGIREDLKSNAEEINEETLPNNWRSDKMIVEFNNHFIGEAMTVMSAAIDKEIPDSLSSIKGILSHIYSDMSQKAAKKDGGYVEARICDFGQEENLSIMVDHIKRLQHNGCSAEDIAIIVRSNNEAQKVADHILSQKGLPENSEYCLDIVSTDALRIEASPLIRFFIALIKRTIKENTLSDAIISGYLGQKDISAEIIYLQSIKILNPIELVESLMQRYDIDKDRGNQAYLQIFYDMVIEYCSREVADTADFIRWWDDVGHKRKLTLPQGSQAINIITAHKSKGLEYKAVIIPYLDWKYAPNSEAIWANSNETPFDTLGNILVGYSATMKDSVYENEYHAVRIKNAIEAFNILYVALTRAQSSLMFIVPQKPSGIGKIVNETLLSQNIISLATEYDATRYIFGEALPHFTKKQPQEKIIIDKFAGNDYSQRIKIHYSTLWSDKGALSPRARGAILHRIFEKAVVKEDVIKALSELKADGLLSGDDLSATTLAIESQLENPIVAGWFDQNATVYCERDIILPNSSRKRSMITRRPDRIVIKDNRCTIIDYKFGAHNKTYSDQINEYATLLKDMGYIIEAGYIWYIATGELYRVV